MAKATFRAPFHWRYFVSLVEAIPSELKADAFKQLRSRHLSGPGRWFLVTTGTIVLLYWNGRLVLATGAGLAVMALVYLIHDRKLEIPWLDIRKFLDQFLSGWNQPLVLAAMGGGAAAFTTYLAASIWAESESHWIASGALLQAAGTLGVLTLLVWQNLNRQTNQERVSVDHMLTELTQDDPLKRLIAVRQLTNVIPDLPDDRNQRQAISDCFRLLLSREQEPIIRDAVLDGLQMLDRVRLLKQSTQPVVNTSVTKRSTTARSRRRVPMY